MSTPLALSRRKLLSGSAAVIAGGVLSSASAVSQPQKSNAGKVSGTAHTSFAQVALTHLHALSKNPHHNPFASGDLAAAYRFHITAFDRADYNAPVTNAVRSLSMPTPFDPQATHSLLEKLDKKHGIAFPAAIRQQAALKMMEVGDRIAPAFAQDMQTYSMLRMQRQAHAGMLTLQKLSMTGKIKTASLARKHPQPHLQTTGYTPGNTQFHHVGYTVYDSDWIDVYGDYGGWGYLLDLDIYDLGGGAGEYYSPDPAPDSFDPNAVFGTFPTLSGGTVSGCTVYFAVTAALAKIGQEIGKALSEASMAALLYELEAGLGIALTGPELLALLGVIAIVAGLGAVFC